jgi:hypothetical protein
MGMDKPATTIIYLKPTQNVRGCLHYTVMVSNVTYPLFLVLHATLPFAHLCAWLPLGIYLLDHFTSPTLSQSPFVMMGMTTRFTVTP